jgi:hypothetical protein
MANQEHPDILAKGVQTWNVWRIKNSGTEPRLTETMTLVLEADKDLRAVWTISPIPSPQRNAGGILGLSQCPGVAIILMQLVVGPETVCVPGTRGRASTQARSIRASAVGGAPLAMTPYAFPSFGLVYAVTVCGSKPAEIPGMDATKA